jgi:hypothetical protein
MGEELSQRMASDMKVYLNNMLMGTISSLNMNTSTLTMKDMEQAYSLVNTPRESTIEFNNSKVDQFQLAGIMGMKVIEQELIKR